MSDSPPISIDSLDDPRIAVYRDLRDREIVRHTGRFIAESEHVVRRLLASDFPVESVLVGQRRLDRMMPVVPACVPLYVVPDAMIHQVVGYKFHSGVIACGRQKSDVTFEQILQPVDEPSTIVICPDLSNHENLGSLVRIACALGADAMVLGEHCCDPFYRLSVRVSMGAIFNLPLIRSCDILADMALLRSHWKYELAATVLDEDAEPLPVARRGDRLGILFGNEAQGLPPEVVDACDRRVTIPMKRGTDSLNVVVAAGIFLHHFAIPS